MRKPEHQWVTRSHRARRDLEGPGEAWTDDPRAEAFSVETTDGRVVGRVVCGLRRQVVVGQVLEDPQLPGAVAAWLVARGARSIDLRASGIEGAPLAVGAISPSELSTPRNEVAASPARIISIAPSNAEVIGALGCFDRVVAVEDSSDWPAEVDALERLGPDLAPDLDRIAELEPDLVVASLTVPGMERNVTELRARGVPVLVLGPRSLDDVMGEVARAGDYLGVPEAAASVVASLEDERDALVAARPAAPSRIYLEWWPRPMFTPGRDCYSNELMALAGGENVFADAPGSSLEIDAARLLAADPDVCFVSWCGVAEDKLDPDRLIGRPGLEALRAAKEGRVYPLDERFSGRPGPRMLEAARRMAAHIRGD